MGRTRRPYLPGAFFHLVARTQEKIHWFTEPAKDRIVEIIGDAVESSRTDLSAYVVMDNHLHVVVQQNEAPLSSFMHPVIRRTALAVKKHWYIDGHVFSRRFRDKEIESASHLRYVIPYVHCNPWRAGMCMPDKYPWSSRRAYIAASVAGDPRVTALRPLYAVGPNRTEAQLTDDYISFEREYMAHADDLCPLFGFGDAYWSTLRSQARVGTGPVKRLDLRDVVKAGINHYVPGIDLQTLRTSRSLTIRRARAMIVVDAAFWEHRGCDIARYLHMSESRVSEIIRGMPERPPARFAPGR